VLSSGKVVGILSWKRVQAEGLAFAVPAVDAARALRLTQADDAIPGRHRGPSKGREGPEIAWPTLKNPYDVFDGRTSAHRSLRIKRRMVTGVSFIAFGTTIVISGVVLLALATSGVAGMTTMPVGGGLLGPGVISIVGGTLLVMKTRRQAMLRKQEENIHPALAPKADGFSFSITFTL
jgi:S1-C subfamily serine protease